MTMIEKMAAARIADLEDELLSTHQTLMALICAAGGEIRLTPGVLQEVTGFTLSRHEDRRDNAVVFRVRRALSEGSEG